MWNWLTNPTEPYTWGFILRVLIKATILFILANVLFAWLQPMDMLSRLSLYNVLLDGRVRMPYGALEPRKVYSITTNNITAMISSHRVATPKATDEFRVLLLGNSGSWGLWLTADETISQQLNAQNNVLPDGRHVTMYNLSHPYPYALRDLLILNQAMQYEPDMIIWIITLDSLHNLSRQFDVMVANNKPHVKSLVEDYGLDVIQLDDTRFVNPTFYDRMLINQRRELNELWLLQFYGLMWNATHIDIAIPDYQITQNDFDEDVTWIWSTMPTYSQLTEDDLLLNVIDVAYNRVGSIPLILVNQPMFIATGQNSHLRYNIKYPRWAFDQYLELFPKIVDKKSWLYCDLWDAIPSHFFSDLPLHITAEGATMFSRLLGDMIKSYMDMGDLSEECE